MFKLVEKDKKTKKEFSNIIPNNIFTNDKKAEDDFTSKNKKDIENIRVGIRLYGLGDDFDLKS